MPSLLLGPVLRCAGPTWATVWVETDAPCEVRVLHASARTFAVAGRHYAVVAVEGLEAGARVPYTVELDGRRVWPREGTPWPPGVLRTPAADRLRVAFGSCRVSVPHEPPHALRRTDHGQGRGIDALRAFALRAAREPPPALPDLLLMLGDQLYADDPSPRVAAAVGARRGDPGAPPAGHLEDFEDYAVAYGEAWREPAVRWLLSTVPTLMVFDDHEIEDMWHVSQAWLEEMRTEPWYDRRVSGGLMAYWLYQHLGNLSPQELAADPLLRAVRKADDGGGVLHRFARDADRQAQRSHWSFCREVGPARLLVMDTRAGRRLEPGGRQMLHDAEWRWVDERLRGDVGHLLVASSLPVFLEPGMQGLEAWSEVLCDGRWGARAARVGERLRRALHLGHWAAFQTSFRRLCAALGEVAAGRRGEAPGSVVVLAGDVHHGYLTQVDLPGARAPVWQAVSSPFRKPLARRERAAMRLGASRAATWLGARLRSSAGVAPPAATWRLVGERTFDNHVSTLELDGPAVRLRIETVAGSHWRDPRLRTVLDERLA